MGFLIEDWGILLAVPVLALHLISVTLTKALRSYSRSRLEEHCAGSGGEGNGEIGAARRDEDPHEAEEGEGTQVAQSQSGEF